MITGEDISQWRANPVTKAFRDILTADRQGIMEAWANGAYKGEALLVMQGKASLLGDVIEGIASIHDKLVEVGEVAE